METMEDHFEKENRKFSKFFSENRNRYKEIFEFLDILLASKNNSTEILKQEICYEQEVCLDYLDSNQNNNIGSGVDFALKACVNNLKNIYMDYKQLKNRTDINEINSTLIHSKGSDFILTELSISYIFYYVQENLYDLFGTYIEFFIESYDKNMTLLNIISIILSILAFSFVIFFMFFSIWKYMKPIKDSTYRINCSFFFIKNYSLS